MDQDWFETLTKHAINRPVDLSDWRLRINAYLTSGGQSVCLSIRKIPKQPMLFEKLGLPSSVNMMLDAPRGIILVGGATGTGKTTTIAALVERINNTRNAHVITVEDPIEYVMTRKKSIFSQREVGVDVPSYYEGVRDAMRQRPDVVVIGEIRDRDTADTALIAAESGHLVVASLHANTVVGAITKMLGFFPSHERESKADALQSTLVGAIGQILLPSMDKSQVVLACELMFNHKHQFSKYIGNKDALQSAFERGEDGVSRTFNQSLLDLVKAKKISDVDALSSVVYNQSELYDQIKTWRASQRAG
jgi:twitching motility protein PilT